jgi:hypothetical protein
MLNNSRIAASFGLHGLIGLSNQPGLGNQAGSATNSHDGSVLDASRSLEVAIINDAFALGLDGENCTCSSSLAMPTMKRLNTNSISFMFASPRQHVALLFGRAFAFDFECYWGWTPTVRLCSA